MLDIHHEPWSYKKKKSKKIKSIWEGYLEKTYR